MAKDVEVRKENRQEREQHIRPYCFICEEEQGVITLKLEMPGVSKEDLVIDVDGNELHITGKRKSRYPDNAYLIRERRPGTYYQSYTLDDTIDRSKIQASLADGVLSVTLQRKEAEKPRKIAIKSS
jgi:HSP20 family protein